MAEQHYEKHAPRYPDRLAEALDSGTEHRVRGMATGQVSSRNTAALLRKELAVGLLNGLVFSVVVAAIAILWYGDLALGLMLAAAILLNLPAGGVVLTTVTDVIGSGAFIGLATFMLLGR